MLKEHKVLKVRLEQQEVHRERKVLKELKVEKDKQVLRVRHKGLWDPQDTPVLKERLVLKVPLKEQLVLQVLKVLKEQSVLTDYQQVR